MAIRSRTALIPLAALALAFSACQPAEDDDRDGRSGDGTAAPALLAPDATLAWSAQLDEDWSPTHAVAVGDTVVISTGWEIDEGTEITGYRPDGSVAWQDSGYGGALLAPVGDDRVLICDDEGSRTVEVADGTEVSEGPADDERCPVADDEAGIPVPRGDEAYTLDGNVLTVDAPDGSYTVTLDEGVDEEIWGVDGGLVAFDDDTDTVLYYQ